jgi:hypothetical protein
MRITEETPLATKTRPEFVLMGVVVEESSTFVLLQDVGANESLVVRANDKIGNWRVVVESNAAVTLIGDGEQITLRLFANDSSP